MIDSLKELDFTNLGMNVSIAVAFILTIIRWLKKNIVNVQQIKDEGADLLSQAKFAKALLKDNDALKQEISSAKVETMKMNQTLSSMLKQKDREIEELKSITNSLILVVKESVTNAVQQQTSE
jgi:hypothetical protein